MNKIMEKIKVLKDQEIGIADILIMGAHLMHELVDVGNDVDVSAVTTLKNGRKYKATLTVVETDEDE